MLAGALVGEERPGLDPPVALAPAVPDSTVAASAGAATGAVVASDATATTDSAGAPKGAAGMTVAFGALLLFTLALPVLSVFGSMPGGILSAIIIGIGLRQAWTMTGAAAPTIRGPFRVGSAAPDAAA